MMLKRIASILLLSLGVSSAYAQQGDYAIVPKPLSMQPANGRFDLGPQTVLVAQSDAARKNAGLFNEFLWNRYGIKLTVAHDAKGKAIVLEEQNDSTEAYSLTAGIDKITIKGGNIGCFYGLQSLLQLI